MRLPTRSSINVVWVLGLIVLAACILSAKARNLKTTTVVEENALSFKTSNYYTRSSPIKGSIWSYLAEPYRETTFKVDHSKEDDGDRYQWKISGLTYTGGEVVHTFTETGKHTVVLMDTKTNQQLTVDVMVKYVRREFRSLTEQDKKRTLDALETLYRVNTEEGQELYGPSYRGMDSFLKEHLIGAGQLDCDHWHDDAGIMVHHVGFTLEAEQAMQLLAPEVSLPYWDYSIDDYLYDGDLGQSPIWDPDFFGAMSPDNDLHVITEGRWAYLKLPALDADDDFSITNPYGLLRSPWNLNPNAHLTRYEYLNGKETILSVGCDAIYTAFQKETIAEINEQLNGETHGPVHLRIGGEWSSPYEEFAVEQNLGSNVALIMKILWRTGYLRYPETCARGEECATSCPAEIYERQGLTAFELMDSLGLFSYLQATTDLAYSQELGRWAYTSLKANWGTAAEDQFFEALLGAMCTPGYLGEMFTSAAPADPSFWILHPFAERFLALRRLVADVKPLDETWGYAHSSHTASDNGYVCDWTGVADVFDWTQMPTCEKTYACEGHGEDDELSLELTGKLAGRSFTNGEFYQFLHPYNEELPYMYDNYDMDHCAEQGYDLLDFLSGGPSAAAAAALSRAASSHPGISGGGMQ